MEEFLQLPLAPLRSPEATANQLMRTPPTVSEDTDPEGTFSVTEGNFLSKKSVEALAKAFETDDSRAQTPIIDALLAGNAELNPGISPPEFLGEKLSGQKVREDSSLVINSMVHWQDSHTFVEKNQANHKSWIANNHALTQWPALE